MMQNCRALTPAGVVSTQVRSRIGGFEALADQPQHRVVAAQRSEHGGGLPTVLVGDRQAPVDKVLKQHRSDDAVRLNEALNRPVPKIDIDQVEVGVSSGCHGE